MEVEAQIDVDPASLASFAEVDGGDDVLVLASDSLDLAGMAFPGLKPRLADSPRPVDDVGGDVALLKRIPLDVGIKSLKPGSLILLERFKPPPNDLHGLLRHRPRSISPGTLGPSSGAAPLRILLRQ